MRLNKYLADRGVGARRKCDQLIAEGRVRVNGQVVSEAGTKVEEGRDKVQVDGRPVGGRERHVYYVLNKPVGVITTLDDPQGRRTVRDLLPRGARVYPVGRLDADTSGLLLLTNDGELAHRLMHPRYGVAKVYRVRLAREPRPEQLRRLGSGVRFERDQVSGPARVRRIDPGFDAIMIEVTIHEGRFRQVRKMCESVGLEVTGLHRVGYGPLRLGPMTRGMFRELSDEEVQKLRTASARPVSRGTPARRSGSALPRRGSGPAATRPERPASPKRPVAAERRRSETDEEGVEETWLPGGRFLEAEDEPVAPARPDSRKRSPSRPSARRAPRSVSDWPARPSGRRGDADWRPGRPGRPDRPTARRGSETTRSGSGTRGRAGDRPAGRASRGPTGRTGVRPTRRKGGRPTPKRGRGSDIRRNSRNPSRRKPR